MPARLNWYSTYSSMDGIRWIYAYVGNRTRYTVSFDYAQVSTVK